MPVSTIAESGVITRMPLVCMSMVASAFQYGWAPTLMPGHHDVDLPAGLGELDDPLERGGHPVHVLGAGVHRDPRARRQREPLKRNRHPLGQVKGGDHARSTPAPTARPSDLVGSPSSTTRVTPSGCRFVGAVTTPATMAAEFLPFGR